MVKEIHHQNCRDISECVDLIFVARDILFKISFPFEPAENENLETTYIMLSTLKFLE